MGWSLVTDSTGIIAAFRVAAAVLCEHHMAGGLFVKRTHIGLSYERRVYLRSVDG